jgi:DNA-binding NarL/FixJ family response regulator
MALIDREAPDLVVTDLRLPGGVDGLAVARHARAHVPPIAVFVISAHDSDHAREAAREIGVSVFLAKPLANATFREAVQRVLGDKASGATDGSGR